MNSCLCLLSIHSNFSLFFICYLVFVLHVLQVYFASQMFPLVAKPKNASVVTFRLTPFPQQQIQTHLKTYLLKLNWSYLGRTIRLINNIYIFFGGEGVGNIEII